jgi:hypothetical protein
MRASPQEVASRAVGVVVPVAVVDEPVAVVVEAVRAVCLAWVLPDVVLKVLVGQIEARVEDLDDGRGRSLVISHAASSSIEE